MYKSNELKMKYLMEIKRATFQFEDKAKSLRQALKLLKGKNHSDARTTLKERLIHIKFEMESLRELEEKLNCFCL